MIKTKEVIIHVRASRRTGGFAAGSVRRPPPLRRRESGREASDATTDQRPPAVRSRPLRRDRGCKKGSHQHSYQYRDVSGSAFGHSRLAARLKTI